jgi:hypothetical protein
MCFPMEETQKTNGISNSSSNSTAVKSSQVNPYVQSAAQTNLQYATGLRDRGFTPYGGQQVANLSGLQRVAAHQAMKIQSDGTGADAGRLIDQYSQAGPQSIQSSTIASRMSPYMSQYVQDAMKPQLRQMDISDAASRKRIDAQATSAGAFGDARQGVESANNTFNNDVLRSGMVAQAYDRAFQTAIGAGAQDVSNHMAAQNANANYGEMALQRALGGAGALQGLQNQQMGINNTINQYGQEQTANNQAGLTAMYNQWLMSQQYPFQTAGLVNSTTQTGASALPADTVMHTTGTQSGVTQGSQEQPNNSGWGVLGSVASAFLPKLIAAI